REGDLRPHRVEARYVAGVVPGRSARRHADQLGGRVRSDGADEDVGLAVGVAGYEVGGRRGEGDDGAGVVDRGGPAVTVGLAAVVGHADTGDRALLAVIDKHVEGAVG